MRYVGLFVVAATLAGALAGCERPYYERYSWVYAADYYYSSGHARTPAL